MGVNLISTLLLNLLLICNILGTLYGFIWYGDQLAKTPWYFLPFIPDSPIASLFVYCYYLSHFNKHIPFVEALAFVTLLKYGLWAVIMNILMINLDHNISIMNVLIMSHGIMAIEAIYFYPRLKIRISGLLVAMIWVFNNDYMDYVLNKYPYYDFIEQHKEIVGYIAFWLSVLH